LSEARPGRHAARESCGRLDKIIQDSATRDLRSAGVELHDPYDRLDLRALGGLVSLPLSTKRVEITLGNQPGDEDLAHCALDFACAVANDVVSGLERDDTLDNPDSAAIEVLAVSSDPLAQASSDLFTRSRTSASPRSRTRCWSSCAR